MEEYKIGDWVIFISDEPSIYASRYAIGDYEIKEKEYIGIIRNVHPITESLCLYTIVTISCLHWICLVHEADIIEKLADTRGEFQAYVGSWCDFEK